MTDGERVSVFIRSMMPERDENLTEIREEALSEGVPIIRPETEALLSFFMETRRPETVLEVGTAVGYSALVMLRALPESATVTTVENYPPRIEKARENIRKAGAEARIRLIAEDASKVLRELSGPYDFIFMDAAKAQYITWLPDVKRLLGPGGVLFSDNVFSDGDIFESHYAVDRRDRTIHKRMREYLYAICHDPELRTSIVNVGDGVALTVKRHGKTSAER